MTTLMRRSAARRSDRHRTRRSTRHPAWVAYALALVFAGASSLAGSTAYAAVPLASTDPVSAVLVWPGSGCTPSDAWATLDANWSQYGAVPLSIQTTTGPLCRAGSGEFTLADLEETGADTVILTSIAWYRHFSSGEIAALQAYAAQGHTILGVGIDFGRKNKQNGALGPVLGITDESGWNTRAEYGEPYNYRLDRTIPAAAALLRGIGHRYRSSSYGDGQKPQDRDWSAADVDGASYLGLSRIDAGAITVYAPATYTAVYVASLADYQSTPNDLQFLYNALIYPQVG